MAKRKNTWSAEVTANSDAMDVAGGTFKGRDPKKIAETIERDAERSSRKKSSPYRSAMSMLTFYINRAGKNLSKSQLAILNRAKEVLREEFGPDAPSKPRATKAVKASEASKKKPTAKKGPAKKGSTKKTAAKKPASKSAAKKAPSKRS